MAVNVKVLWFGAAQEIAGTAEEEFTAEDTETLRGQMIIKHPGLVTITFRLALNGSLLKEDSPLKKNDIIAVLPPFAGG